MNFRIHVKDERGDWWEDMNCGEVVDRATAEQKGREMIEAYNRTLYQGDRARTFIEAQMGGERELEHVWQKTNLVTISGKDGLYDTARCKVCGCEARRYGLGEYTRIGKWKKVKWQFCPGQMETPR